MHQSKIEQSRKNCILMAAKSIDTVQKELPEVIDKKAVLKNVAMFMGKTPVLEFYLVKL